MYLTMFTFSALKCTQASLIIRMIDTTYSNQIVSLYHIIKIGDVVAKIAGRLDKTKNSGEGSAGG